MIELAPYQKTSLERFLTLYEPKGKNVLEIGSDENAAILRELSTKNCGLLVGVNPAIIKSTDKQDNNYVFLNADGMNLPLKDRTIDAIISIATFEHISNVEAAFSEMYRVLKPGGLIYSNFSPIWSCPHGHHVYAVVDGEEVRFWKPEKNHVPDFAQLLMSPEELESFLLKKINKKLAQACIQWIYHGSHINRYFYKDYIRLFKDPRFKIKLFSRSRRQVDSEVERHLVAKYGKENDYGCYAFEVVLEKVS